MPLVRQAGTSIGRLSVRGLRYFHLPPLHAAWGGAVHDVRGEVRVAGDACVSDVQVVRPRFAIGERVCTVLGEAWFDASGRTWKGRFVFIPLDRSLSRNMASSAVARGARRSDVERQLRETSDRVIDKAFRAIITPRQPGRRGR